MKLPCFALAALLCSLISAAQAASSGGLQVRDAWVRQPPPGRSVAAGYATVVNASAEPRRLISASSPAAERVEFHTHRHVDGMMRMRRMTEVVIEPGASVEFRPGGHHLMLFGLTNRTLDTAVPITLHTADGETLEMHPVVRRHAPQTSRD